MKAPADSGPPHQGRLLLLPHPKQRAGSTVKSMEKLVSDLRRLNDYMRKSADDKSRKLRLPEASMDRMRDQMHALKNVPCTDHRL